MTQQQSIRRRDGVDSGERYLEAAVHTASPARMRLMLIERAIGVSDALAASWRDGSKPGPNEYYIRLLELLNELLDGIKGGSSEGENDLCRTVADMYVFLCKHIVAAESTNDADAIAEVKTVLEVDCETWRAVCAQEQPADANAAVSNTNSAAKTGLNLEG